MTEIGHNVYGDRARGGNRAGTAVATLFARSRARRKAVMPF